MDPWLDAVPDRMAVPALFAHRAVHLMKTETAENYVDRRQLAALMGISLATIDRMVANGMPSETWGMRARRFLPSDALAWARDRDPTVRNRGSRRG